MLKLRPQIISRTKPFYQPIFNYFLKKQEEFLNAQITCFDIYDIILYNKNM